MNLIQRYFSPISRRLHLDPAPIPRPLQFLAGAFRAPLHQPLDNSSNSSNLYPQPSSSAQVDALPTSDNILRQLPPLAHAANSPPVVIPLVTQIHRRIRSQ